MTGAKSEQASLLAAKKVSAATTTTSSLQMALLNQPDAVCAVCQDHPELREQYQLHGRASFISGHCLYMPFVPKHRVLFVSGQTLQIELQEFKLQNIVGSCDVKFPIRLEGLAFAHEKFCSVSHAMVHAILCPNMSMLLYHSQVQFHCWRCWHACKCEGPEQKTVLYA